MNRIEKINKLLDLYFAGDTTTEQEQELKKYFASENIAAEHKIYQQLFDAFETEKSEKYPDSLPKIKPSAIRKKIFVMPLISTVIAASILMLIGIFQTERFDSYVIINGKRINDKELALHIAQAKISKVSESLKSGMKPINSMNVLHESMESLQKVKNIKNKMKNTFNKVHIKL
ncbi:MAG: hypothetical protein LBH30_01925 [Prevotellaceae bacterium]|jgi:hypothetical protein|nr:hypothetical protein [Prevotellaceae bacterium]